MSVSKTIDLGNYRDGGTTVLSGRPKGADLRKTLDLSRTDLDPEPVEVVVPRDILSLNSSFFLGLFGESIRRLGLDGFASKYIFNCAPAIKEDVMDGERQALEESNPLAFNR